MTLYDQIKDYLESKEKDYSEGLNLFLMVSNHRSLALYLQRKKNAEKLEYELSKLLKNLPAKLQKITMPEKPTAHENSNNRKSENEGAGATPEHGAGTTNSQENNSGNTGASSSDGEDFTGTQKPEDNSGAVKNNTTEGNDENSDHKIIEFRTVRPEDIPEEMRPLYDEIVQKHKEMRSNHEKMKLAETDEARAEFRKQLVDCDDFVNAGWKQIDEFLLLQNQSNDDGKKKEETKPVQEKKEPEATDIAKEISAARTYLSRNISEYHKAEEKDRPGLKKKLEKRINILISSKASVSKKTRKTLIDMAIIPENSELLAE